MGALRETIPIDNTHGELPLSEPTTCEQCGKTFEPRSGSGGKAQRFCSTKCRAAFHAHAQRGQRSPTYSAPQTLPAVIPPAKKDEPAATPADDPSNWCWSVPDQARIECSATVGGEIEIEQINPLGDSENQRIFVTRGNAVQLARHILYVAGFKSVLIATYVTGGYCDVEDGDLPEHFGRDQR
jgi:hypothetical protein